MGKRDGGDGSVQHFHESRQHDRDRDQPGITSARSGATACRLRSHCFLPKSQSPRACKDAPASLEVSSLFQSGFVQVWLGWTWLEKPPCQFRLPVARPRLVRPTSPLSAVCSYLMATTWRSLKRHFPKYDDRSFLRLALRQIVRRPACSKNNSCRS